jgi:amino-acid N-acetyltransferase
MSEVTIRRATSADQGIIKQLVREESLDPTSLNWPQFLIAERGSEVVGIGQIRLYRGCRELGSLVVKRGFRNRGVGALLVEALLAQETGDVYLECASYNQPYYERFGFRRIPWWQAPMPLKLKAGFGQIARLFGWRVVTMKREATQP